MAERARWATRVDNCSGYTAGRRYKIIGEGAWGEYDQADGWLVDDEGSVRPCFSWCFTDFADKLDEDAAKESIQEANGASIPPCKILSQSEVEFWSEPSRPHPNDSIFKSDAHVAHMRDKHAERIAVWEATHAQPSSREEAEEAVLDHIQQSLRLEATGIDATLAEGVKKYDAGKAPVMSGCIQRFPLALQQVALVSEYGKRKYGTFEGWETLPNAQERYTDALGRHALLAKSEGPYDAGDSGLPHLAQVAWNALAVLELALRNGNVEMTSGNEIENGAPVIGSNGRLNGFPK